MIHKIIGLVIFAAIVVFGLSVYLSPNDLEKCNAPGDGDCRMADAVIVVSGEVWAVKCQGYVSEGG